MSKTIDVDDDLIRKLAGLMDETGLTEIEIGQNDFTVRVARGTPAVASYAAPYPGQHPGQHPSMGHAPAAEVPAIASHADHPGVVTSPMVGVAYTAAEPGAADFVNVGDAVSEGQVVLLIEAMKVFNQIKAPRSGTVKNILVESGSPVEFGEPLLIIE